MKVDISLNGAITLENLSINIKNLFSDIENEGEVLYSIISNTEELGIYEDSIKNLIVGVSKMVEQNHSSIDFITKSLNDTADEIRELMNIIGDGSQTATTTANSPENKQAVTSSVGKTNVQKNVEITPDISPLAATKQKIRLMDNGDGTTSKVSPSLRKSQG